MPFARTKEFYDLVGNGLAYAGYSGETAFNEFVNDVFAKKYNSASTFEQLGFPLNPNVPINPTYEQLEASMQPYTMATYVDVDSDGPAKNVNEATLRMGSLPTFKHEYTLSRKTIREQMQLKDLVGNSTQSMNETVLGLLFTATDTLLGGNYNTIKHQRDQIVSNECKLVVDKTNNPLGVTFVIDFGVAAKNKKTSKWYTVSGDDVTQAPEVGTSINPIKVLKSIRKQAEDDGIGSGHFEMAKSTFDALMSIDYFRKMYSVANRPDITDPDMQKAFANMVPDETIRQFLSSAVGAEINVIDSAAFIDKFNTSTKKSEVVKLDGFKDGVIVFVPDGPIGDGQFGRPVALQTPSSRIALFDGGRTMIRQFFEDKTMTQIVQSEVTGLLVPNKVRWMYYLTVKG